MCFTLYFYGIAPVVPCSYLIVSSAKGLTSGGLGLCWRRRICNQEKYLNLVQRSSMRAKWNARGTFVSVHHSICLLRPLEIMTSTSSCFVNLVQVPLLGAFTQNHTKKEMMGKNSSQINQYVDGTFHHDFWR